MNSVSIALLATALGMRAAAQAPPVAPAAAGAPAARATRSPRAPGDTGRSYTAADVHFMSGMILHHAQAVLIAGWAPTHDASPSLRALCERVVVGQRDEIGLLQRWLADRHEGVPAGDSSHPMTMAGMELMPGMLTAEQLARLDHARGSEFDRLFLRYMIQHHQGAITMVNDLFGSQGGEEETVYRMAANIFADQTTEIDRMQRMLATLLFAAHSP
jgi:uncharacterized protein (DUF305 family)